MGEGSASKSFITLLITAMILSGAANTLGIMRKYFLVYKLQNTSHTNVDGWTATDFNHPFMQATTMFCGEALCIFLFLSIKKKPEYKQGCIEAAAKGYNIEKFYILDLKLKLIMDG